MEKHPIDRIVKNHLSDRNIEPTANAWDRLDSMLTIAEEKPKNKKNVIRMSLLAAASFIGIILVMTNIVFVDRQGVINENNNLIIADNSLPSNAQKFEIVESNEAFSDLEAKVTSVEQTSKNSKVSKKSETSKNENKINTVFQSTVNTDSNNKNVELVTNIIEEEKGLNTQSIAENINESSKFKINADKLLAKIEHPKSKLANTSDKQVHVAITSKIDPNKLLREAENEVNEKFMHKIFKNLQETTVQVLTSVSQRNIEK